MILKPCLARPLIPLRVLLTQRLRPSAAAPVRQPPLRVRLRPKPRLKLLKLPRRSLPPSGAPARP